MQADAPARVIIESLRAGDAIRFRARGASMWPAVRGGALVEVTPCAAADLRAGELGAFERDGAVVVHRVAAHTATSIRFTGDAVSGSDGDIEHARILGRARVLEQRRLRLRIPSRHHLRTLARALRRRLGW
jgi:hypothetical protein